MMAQRNTPTRPTGPVDDRSPLAPITTAGFSLGKRDAPLTMVEFTDLQCPFCAQFHGGVFERIKSDYIDTGKLLYITRDFPLETIHPVAMIAARAARCGAEQGRFWEMRHQILTNNSHLSADSLGTVARGLGLDEAAFTKCVADAERFRGEIQKDIADGTAAGVTGTPSFVIGRNGGTQVTDGIRIVGAQPYSVFDARFKELLGQRSGQSYDRNWHDVVNQSVGINRKSEFRRVDAGTGVVWAAELFGNTSSETISSYHCP
jgi:protein-disulfide isomerase